MKVAHPANMPTARVVGDLNDGAVRGTVELDATRERAFRALTSIEVIQWLAVDGAFRLERFTADLCVKGKWYASGVRADNRRFVVHGEYVSVEPPREVIYTWTADWNPSELTSIRFSLDSARNGTRVILCHEGLSSRKSCADYANVWLVALDRLAAHVASNMADLSTSPV
jgi:uncharacterized protein YndB with AHSA1/START domain